MVTGMKSVKKFSKERRLQYGAMCVHIFLVTVERVITPCFLLYFLVYGKILRIVCLAYLIFIFLDWKAPYFIGRRWKWWSWYSRLLCEYFPINLVTTVELPTDRNYLVTMHPHGVLFLAFFITFGLDAFNLAKKGLRGIIATIDFNFVLPFTREYFLWSGGISASESAIKRCLLDPTGGNLVALLPGGAAEASYCNPGVYKLFLNRRKGFCRVALQTGASLVPTFAFGEVDAYYVKPRHKDSIIYRFMKYWMGINPVMFSNKPNGFSIIPRRVPITVVMGAPMSVPKVDNPTKEEIDCLHARYVDEIKKIFDTEKHKYLPSPYPELIID